LPRRHTFSAAGVLAVLAPAAAQDAPALRGSIGVQDAETASPAALESLQRRRQPGGSGTAEEDEGRAGADAFPNDLAMDPSLLPTAPEPPPLHRPLHELSIQHAFWRFLVVGG